LTKWEVKSGVSVEKKLNQKSGADHVYILLDYRNAGLHLFKNVQIVFCTSALPMFLMGGAMPERDKQESLHMYGVPERKEKKVERVG
jgi:hypothetical protein